MPQLPSVASLGEMPKLSVPKSVPDLTIEPSVLPVGSTEAYSRIARGAMACWFGPDGRYAATHIFHADAAPTMSGGGVEIVIHERAIDQPKPWGYKAFRITLTETQGLDGSHGSGARITVDNLRMPDAEVPRMRAEVFQWATGTEGCKSAPADAAPGSPVPTATSAAPLVATDAPAPRGAPAAAAVAATAARAPNGLAPGPVSTPHVASARPKAATTTALAAKKNAVAAKPVEQPAGAASAPQAAVVSAPQAASDSPATPAASTASVPPTTAPPPTAQPASVPSAPVTPAVTPPAQVPVARPSMPGIVLRD